MKNSICIGLLILTNCTFRPISNDFKVFPATKDAMLIRQARYVSSTSSELVFELDLFHVAGFDYSHFTTNFFLAVDTAYLNFPSDGSYRFLSHDYVNVNAVAPSSTIILIDESGSYDSLDHFNLRSQGIVKIGADFSVQGEYLLGGFSVNGNLSDGPVEFLEAGFGQFTPSQMSSIFDLAKRTGGKSNLYDAVNASLDKLIAEGTGTKNLIVLAHAPDELSSSTLSALITKATGNQITVHGLFLGPVSKASGLAKLTESTSGLFVNCQSAAELLAVLEDLYVTLSDGTLEPYRVQIKYKPASGTISSGQELWFTINTHDTFLDIDNNPMVAYIKVP